MGYSESTDWKTNVALKDTACLTLFMYIGKQSFIVGQDIYVLILANICFD